LRRISLMGFEVRGWVRSGRPEWCLGVNPEFGVNVVIPSWLNGSLGRGMVHKCPTVMIAEPGSNLVAALYPWLADEGYEVKVVGNIKDALMTLQSEKIHVLVMDVCMAQAMGYEAIPIIKGLCRHLPIIITTQANNPEQESTIRQKGIFYYHVTSFGMEELMLAISNAMARSMA
jgi:DNA-binding NtrC family response regulator